MQKPDRFDRLLGKSIPPAARPGQVPVACSLPGHLASVVGAARTVVRITGPEQLSAMGLPASCWLERLNRIAVLAAALHDLGKANDHFQAMLRGNRGQGLRHEWVTVWLLLQPAWREVLSGDLPDGLDFQTLWWAIAGHHPSYSRPVPPLPVEGAGTRLRVLVSHEDFHRCLDLLADELGTSLPRHSEDVDLPLCGQDDVFTFLRRTLRESRRVWDGLPSAERRFAAACKASMVSCDVAGSALPKVVPDSAAAAQWITRALENRPAQPDLEEVVGVRLGGSAPRHFQEKTASSRTRVTLIRAGCGTGKTIAAYLWAARRHPGKRLFLCYPTTGTATEGFRDYLFDQPAGTARFGARLFHGRADVDLELILEVRGDIEAEDAFLRLESLDTWSTPIASCTADTVLGIIQNSRRGLYAWPALAGAAFVFDEIHAYDDRLFGALLRFLRDIRGVPALLMTASLPSSREAALRSILSGLGESMEAICGPADLERLPRYRRSDAAVGTDPLPAIQDGLACGEKVLWVSNTVGRAMAAAEAAEATGLSPLIYHSRFRYEDRVQRHRQVIEAFRSAAGVLAVCTQVAEVSLDISADLLVTDLAPVPALIQRLGRLNRRAEPAPSGEPSPPTRPFLVLEPHTALPYGRSLTEDPYVSARRWLGGLGTGELSQADLSGAWEALDIAQEAKPVGSAWLDGGPETRILELREGSPGITVLLSQDAEAVRTGRRPLSRLALPMPPPRGADWRQWGRVRGCPVAPDGTVDYDPERGAQWHVE